MSLSLTNHTAVISGALGDIGRAIATELASRGANVALSDLHQKKDASAFLRALAERAVRVRYDQVDVADDQQVKSWLAAVEAELGTANLIIPNAAIVTRARIQEMTSDEWSRELQVNLTGAFHMAQAGAARLLARQAHGRIVFIGSWAGHAPHPSIPAYCVAKAGLRMLCRCMALELAPSGILVNEVAPGYVDAGLSAKVWLTNPGARERAAARVPTGQLIAAEEVAQQVAQLCEPSNRHTTGSVLLMDGGLSLVTPAHR